MMNRIPSPATPITIQRTYQNLAGVDFSSDISKVQLNRSPYSVNMYRDYNAEQGKAIETRPGFRKLKKFAGKIYGIHTFAYNNNGVIQNKTLIHTGTKLYEWDNFPEDDEEVTEIYSSMNSNDSVSFAYNNALYINDGLNYLKYYKNGSTFTVASVSTNSFIPTTTNQRKPTGGGKEYQEVNLLQPKRKNSFLADGESTDYVLDTTDLDNTTVIAVVNNEELVENTDFTVDRENGTITFNTAPLAPEDAGITKGQDNVIITFAKTIAGNEERIAKCRISIVYDNRIFFSGNPKYPNSLFNSAVDDPTYIPDMNYFQDGTDSTAIMALLRIGEHLAVVKEENQQDATVYYHTGLTTNLKRTYPAVQGLASSGCIAINGATIFRDDAVFISRLGLEAVAKLDLSLERSIEHRSSLVDGKLTNESDLKNVKMTEWNGYLVLLINGKIYLADSRQKYQGFNSFEYEWYYWDNIGTWNEDVFNKACIIKEYKGELIFGTEDGYICKFNTDMIKYPGELLSEAYSDDNKTIYSCWSTLMDSFGVENKYKISNKKGGVAKLKSMAHGICKLKEKTNKSFYKEIKRHNGGYFDFSDIDFADFTFNTFESNRMVYKIKEKKWAELSLFFYSDELKRPFGIYSATLEAFVGGYIKK